MTTDTLTTAEAAAILDVDTSQVRYLCIRGTLNAEKRSGVWLVIKDAKFDAYAESPTRRQGKGRTSYADLQAERDELRRQRDEALQALQALRSIMHHKDSMLSTDIEYIGIYQRARRILAQYDKDKTK